MRRGEEEEEEDSEEEEEDENEEEGGGGGGGCGEEQRLVVCLGCLRRRHQRQCFLFGIYDNATGGNVFRFGIWLRLFFSAKELAQNWLRKLGFWKPPTWLKNWARKLAQN